MKNRQLKHVLAENVRVACHKFDINTVELCKRSGGSPAAINMLMNADKQPTLETVEAVAEGLAIEPWVLFMDKLTDNMIGEERTPELVRKFSNCSTELKQSIMDYVDQMAELNERRKD